MNARPQRFEMRPRHRWLRRIAFGASYPVGFFVVCGGAVLLFDHGDDRFVTVVGIGLVAAFALVLFIANAVRNDPPPLVVDAQGVRIREVVVPWPSIWQIVVIPPGGTGRSAVRTRIGLRLRTGAPLPHGLDQVIYDPATPRALHLSRALPDGTYDDGHLAAAVRAFAPHDVELVVEDGEAPETTRPHTSAGRQDAVAIVHDVRMHDYSSTSSSHFTYRPHPVVGFVLPDGRQVIAEARRPGIGRPGEQVMVSYDAADPGDVYVHGDRPKAVRRWTEI